MGQDMHGCNHGENKDRGLAAGMTDRCSLAGIDLFLLDCFGCLGVKSLIGIIIMMACDGEPMDLRGIHRG